ncbi:hypothetical protein O7622_11275 [Micromonospora sp. WMMD1076]|uniref:hypothetical protein n=1 Tax=Micromonospora sp. WMMD1076 TaxID=3016103 RepID=UPI00249A3EFB|nr:hypothetical protein [Micromonospora sp. WMMD1076]WFF09091.1 hypothetical protein O7622_11275 [Micromonospora sp. WMMD1076]
MSELHKAAGRIGPLTQRHGADSPEVAAAKTEMRVVRIELAICDLINSAPAPTPEQLDRLRRLLPPVGITGSAVAA